MGNRKRRGDYVAGVPPLSDWPAPPEETIAEARREGYLNNKRAVELWVAGEQEAVLIKRTGRDARRARSLFVRCAKTNPATGAINGFWPCIPGSKVGTNRRERVSEFDPKQASAGRGLCGALGDLLRRHSTIEKALKAFVRNREVAPGISAGVLTQNKLYQVFLAACRAEGLHIANEWPFNTKRMGYKAVCRWYKLKRYEHPVSASVNEEGNEKGSETKRKYAAITHGRPKPPRLAYERVELDEHHIDGMFSIGIPVNGQVIETATVRRLWALVIRETRGGAVLASTVAFGDRYNRADVLRLIHQAVCPPQRYALTFENPDYRYKDGAAFPAELAGLEKNGWQELAMDADAAHTSQTTWDAIDAALACKTKHERVGEATARPNIEGFFAVLADMASWLASATGNRPDSPARRNPEAAARRHNILAAKANELLDVVCRNFNATANGAADGISPLNRTLELMIRGELYRHEIGSVSTDKLWMLCPMYPARFNRISRKGRLGPLYIELFGGRYTSPQLANNQALARMEDQGVKLYVQEDARFAYAVPDANNSLMFPVAITGKLAATPHNLQWRRAFTSFVKNVPLGDRARSPHTMIGYLTGLAEVAKEGGAAATLLADVTEFMTRYQTGRTSYIGTTKEEAERLRESVVGVDLDDDPGARMPVAMPGLPPVLDAAVIPTARPSRPPAGMIF